MKTAPQSSIPPAHCKALSEAALWDCVRNGEKEAFDLVYQRYVRVLYNYGIRFTPDRVIVEDCIQDLFVEIWEKKNKLSATSSIKFYLFKSLRRRIMRKLLNEARLHQKLLNRGRDDFEITFSHEQAIVERQVFEEWQRKLRSAVGALSRRQKEAIFLKYFEDLSYAEIASVMSIQTGAVYKLICGAIKILRRQVRKTIFTLFLLHLLV